MINKETTTTDFIIIFDCILLQCTFYEVSSHVLIEKRRKNIYIETTNKFKSYDQESF